MIDLSHPYPIPIHSHETPRFLGQVMIPFGRTQNSGRIEGSDVLMWNDPLNANHGVSYIYLHGPTILGDFEGKCWEIFYGAGILKPTKLGDLVRVNVDFYIPALWWANMGMITQVTWTDSLCGSLCRRVGTVCPRMPRSHFSNISQALLAFSRWVGARDFLWQLLAACRSEQDSWCLCFFKIPARSMATWVVSTIQWDVCVCVLVVGFAQKVRDTP